MAGVLAHGNRPFSRHAKIFIIRNNQTLAAPRSREPGDMPSSIEQALNQHGSATIYPVRVATGEQPGRMANRATFQ
jgi:hypothetical protein